jgi:hypothetical protein
MIEAYSFFSKTRKTMQAGELINRTKDIGNQVLIEMFSFIWSIILQIWWLLIIAGVVSWHFRNAKSKTLETVASVFSDLEKISYSFKPTDFVVLVATLWVGATIGFAILGDVHDTNIQVLASESMLAIYEHTNSPFVDQIALFGLMQANLWLLLLLTLFTSILWVFAGLYGLKRSALTLGIFSIVLFLFSIYYTFMALDMGRAFLMTFYSLVFLIVPFELFSLWWERHITKKNYIKSGSGTIHYVEGGCSQAIENVTIWTKVVISDQDLHKHEVCIHCARNQEPKK